ncbi:MAG: 4a-hydroxytetrahydrobiopterin dehydratase [Actinomycetes bacterium]
MGTQRLTGPEIADVGLEGWAFLGTHLATRLPTGDFATGLALLDEIGAAAEEADHHPDLDLRYGHLDVRLTSHDAGGVTQRDVRMARRVTELAGSRGVTPDCSAVSRVDLALDTPDRSRVLPFWSAALGMAGGGHVPEDEIRDPAGSHPNVWFQDSGDQEPRQRWHLDVWLDPGQVQGRIDAALAAGGELLSDEQAPSFWVLADPDGNKVCLCTWQDRTGKRWE